MKYRLARFGIGLGLALMLSYGIVVPAFAAPVAGGTGPTHVRPLCPWC